MTNRTLIENGSIITGFNHKIISDKAILIEDGLIKQIAKKSQIKPPFNNIIDATDKIILPGLIDTHTHCYSALALGFTKIKPATHFDTILKELWWKIDKHLTLEDIYISALTTCIHCIRHGCTTIFDHHSSPDATLGSLEHIARAILNSGLRGCLSYEISDRNGEKNSYEGMEENLTFISSCKNNPRSQLKALLGLHASFTLSDETLNETAYRAKEYGTGFHIHAAEAELDQAETMKRYNRRVVERLADHDILGPKTIAAHCVHLNETEMRLLENTDTMVAHCPQSNMNNGVGIADIITLMNKNILVGLGTDAITTNLFEEMRTGLWAQHLKNNPSIGFNEIAKTVFQNNQLIANRIFDDIDIGLIQEGYAADLILIDYNPATPIENNNVMDHLLYGISQMPVDTTIVNGVILMKNKKLQLDLNENEIFAKARELALKLWKRV